MKGRRFSSTLAILVMLLLTLTAAAAADSGTRVSLEPSTTAAYVGDTVNVNIRISDVSDLYGAEVHIRFDPARLQALDDDETQPGVQILPGSLFPIKSDPSYVAQNQVDNLAGTVDFAMTLLAPELSVSGSGTLATVRFAAKMQGTAQLSWISVRSEERRVGKECSC